MAKKTSKAGSLIKDLIKKGFSRKAIGRAVDRDSSLISQIERGIKPGSNLVESLQTLKDTGKAAPAARRQTKAGKPVKVRQKSIRGKSGDVIYTAEMKAQDKTYIQALKSFLKRGKNVTVKLTFTKWKAYRNSKTVRKTVTIYTHGRNPQKIIDSAKNEGMTIADYLIMQAKLAFKPESAEGFKGLSFLDAGEDDE
jgi:hypothetical protein